MRVNSGRRRYADVPKRERYGSPAQSGRSASDGWEDGGQEWNRTTDTRIFSPLLYQLSYLAVVSL